MNKYIVKVKVTKKTKKILNSFDENEFNCKTRKFTVKNKVYSRGATRVLRKKFYSNYKRPNKIRTKGGSSKALGTYFHRQVFHHFTCLEGGNKKVASKCQCNKAFGGTKKTRALTKNSISSRRIKSLKKILKLRNLEIIQCEVPIAWKEINTATCLDALAVSITNPNHFYVLEFKTGYSTAIRKRASTKRPDGYGPGNAK